MGQRQGPWSWAVLAPDSWWVCFSLEVDTLKDPSYAVDDVVVLEVEVKGSVEPFQVLLEPYTLVIPGENYIGVNVKKDFKVSHCLSPA